MSGSTVKEVLLWDGQTGFIDPQDEVILVLDFGSQSESASLLLQEYEKRGVGWLWQVDDDSTAILMQHFYEGLQSTERPSKAPACI